MAARQIAAWQGLLQTTGRHLRSVKMPFEDKGPALSGSASCTFHADDVAASQNFRKQYETRPNVVKAEDMPWERSADGLIKHLVHHRLNSRERCVEAYMQFLKAGQRSGKPRPVAEWVRFRLQSTGSDRRCAVPCD